MTWQSQPPSRRDTRYDWPEIMRSLHRRPGRWLLVAEQVPRSIRTNIRRGRIAALRDDVRWDYHARTRKTNGNRADLWMSATRKEGSDAAAESGD